MKHLKSIALSSLLLFTVVLITSQKSNEGILYKLSMSYDNLDVAKSATSFGKELIDRGILEQTDLAKPSLIYSKLEAVYPDLQPSDFGIDTYIDKSPLTEFRETENILQASQTEQAQLALFTYYQLVSENYLNFHFHLDEKRLVHFNNQDLPINSLEAVIFEEIEKRSEQNVNVSNARMVLSADEYTDFEFVTFITGKFREMGLRQVIYKRKGAN